MRESRSLRIVAALLLALPLAAAPALPGEAAPGPDSNKPAVKPPAPKVFTNRDLSKYRTAKSSNTLYVDTSAMLRAKDAAAAAVPDETIYPDEKARRVAEIQELIQQGEARAADLDKRLAFMANPFLPPPQITPEEIAAQKGMSQKEGYQALQAEKAALVEKLAALHADLEKVSALPTRPRGAAAAPSPDAGTTPEP